MLANLVNQHLIRRLADCIRQQAGSYRGLRMCRLRFRTERWSECEANNPYLKGLETDP